ncbi:helix-turn-helix domain-containing protein [Mangrovicoccus algicola]|uniref:Helix-turn-helix domain-containing protein n=1 Tax=Mangrovicoccus algicola TaxID=2771008 RepID=A0A8J6YWQ0_9RHOB|nr:hypothetical protein [Mangrovicoccus algicola]MBE3637433.1 hypothetical protein [Mangrovicoccus algicola]
MSRKPYKRSKKGAGRFVQLHEWVQATEAWATLKPGPRALYIELKRRYNGANNGQILLSYRDAARLLSVHRNTVGGWFDELEARGFIHAKRGHCLGPSGIGETSHWALDEEATMDGKPARKAFASWTPEQKPRTGNRTPRQGKQDGGDRKSGHNAGPVLKIVT